MGIKLIAPVKTFFNQIDPPGNEPPAEPKKEETKKESEEMPAWAKSLQTNLENLLQPKQQSNSGKQEQTIPVPTPPARKEADHQDEPPAKKKSFLDWLM